MVPDVMTTLLKRSNMGLMAMDGSKHLGLVGTDIIVFGT